MLKLFVDHINSDGEPIPNCSVPPTGPGWYWPHHYDSILQSGNDLAYEPYCANSRNGYYLLYFGDEVAFDALSALTSTPKVVAEASSRNEVVLLLLLPFEPLNYETTAAISSYMQQQHITNIVVCSSSHSPKIVDDLQIKFMHHDFFAMLISDAIRKRIGSLDNCQYDWSVQKVMPFITLNHRWRAHRYHLLQELRRRGILTDHNYSFVGTGSPPMGEQPFVKLPCVFARRYIRRNSVIPLRSPDGYSEESHFSQIDIGFMSRAYVNVVTETLFYGDLFFLTEKTFKPLLFGQPFIIVGPRGTLRHLREQGYRTFGEIWNESYDDMPNTFDKLKVIAGLLEGLTLKRLRAAEPQLREICAYNRTVFINKDYRKELIMKLESGLRVTGSV
jgi:hypothetical protein